MSFKKRLGAAAAGLGIKFSTTGYRYATGDADIGLPANEPVNLAGQEIVPDNIGEFLLIEPASYALLGYSMIGSMGKSFKENLYRTISGSASIIGLRAAIHEISNQLGYVGPHGYNPAEPLSIIPFSISMGVLAAVGYNLGRRAFGK